MLMAFALAACAHKAPPPAASQPGVPVAIVREGSVEQTVALAGRVGAPAGTQTKLSFSVPGTIAAVDVRLGQHVSQGETLARLDDTPYSLGAQQAGAEARAAAAGAALAGVDRVSVRLQVDEAQLARQERLYQAGVVALRDVQAAQGAVAADRAEAAGAREQQAQAQAQSHAASLHAQSAQYDVSRTSLRAPFDATVAGIFAQAGQTVDAATAVVALASSAQNGATLDVPVSQLTRVQAGEPVTLRTSDARWNGRISGIATAVDPATGLAVASVAGVPANVAPGTPVDATVVVGVARGVVVPRSAVVEDPQTGAELVFVRSAGGEFEARRVTIDARDDRFARVTSGVHIGERVASSGAIDLLAPAGQQP